MLFKENPSAKIFFYSSVFNLHYKYYVIWFTQSLLIILEILINKFFMQNVAPDFNKHSSFWELCLGKVSYCNIFSTKENKNKHNLMLKEANHNQNYYIFFFGKTEFIVSVNQKLIWRCYFWRRRLNILIGLGQVYCLYRGETCLKWSHQTKWNWNWTAHGTPIFAVPLVAVRS